MAFYNYKSTTNNTIIRIDKDSKAIAIFNSFDGKWNDKIKRWTVPNEKYPKVEAKLVELGYTPINYLIDVYVIKLGQICETISSRDNIIISVIKSCEGYKWIPERMRWSIPIGKFDAVT